MKLEMKSEKLQLIPQKCKGSCDYPGGSVVKNPSANAGDTCSIPGSGISLGDGNGNPFQYSRLENLMDRGAWKATVHEVIRKLDPT